jgi:hypothetical protein
MNKTCGNCYGFNFCGDEGFGFCEPIHRMPASNGAEMVHDSCNAERCPGWELKKDKADGEQQKTV